MNKKALKAIEKLENLKAKGGICKLTRDVKLKLLIENFPNGPTNSKKMIHEEKEVKIGIFWDSVKGNFDMNRKEKLMTHHTLTEKEKKIVYDAKRKWKSGKKNFLGIKNWIPE